MISYGREESILSRASSIFAEVGCHEGVIVLSDVVVNRVRVSTIVVVVASRHDELRLPALHEPRDISGGIDRPFAVLPSCLGGMTKVSDDREYD